MTDAEEKALEALEADLAGIPWGGVEDTESSAPMPEDVLEQQITAIREAGKKSRAEFLRVVGQLAGQAFRAASGLPR